LSDREAPDCDPSLISNGPKQRRRVFGDVGAAVREPVQVVNLEIWFAVRSDEGLRVAELASTTGAFHDDHEAA